MLRRIALALFGLHLAAAGAEAADATKDSRLALVERTRLVRTPGDLRDACGGRDGIRACMHLSAQLIAGPCAEEPDGWRLRAPAIRVEATRVLLGASRTPFDDGTVQHEKNHAGDFRRALAAYLDDLDARRFASERACRAAGDAEMRGFTKRMTQIRDASNRKLHAKRAENNDGG